MTLGVVPGGRSRERLGLVAVTLGAMLAYPSYAVWRGQDVDWDQLNYHFASVVSLMRRSWWRDIAPSQLQSWFNPAAYISVYLLARHLGALPFTIVVAFVQSLNAPILYRLALRLGHADRRRPIAAAIATVVGLTAATVLGEVGTTFFDILAAPFVSAALLLVLVSLERGTAGHAAPAAGLLIGAITGLKSTNAIYALALGTTIVVLAPRGTRITLALRFGAASALGFVVSYGWWALFLWRDYGNPFFPFFNGLFHSHWLDGAPAFLSAGSGADTVFVPASFLQAATYPAFWALGGTWATSEEWFRDARLTIAIPLVLAAAIAMAHRRRAAYDRDSAAVLMFATVTFCVWMRVFAIQRYLVPLEMLIGVVLMAAIRVLVRPERSVAVQAVLAVLLIAWTKPPDYGHVRFHPHMMLDDMQALYSPDALYVMIGADATAYAAIALPPDTRTVRIGGNMPLDPARGLGAVAARLIATTRRPLRTLSTVHLVPGDIAMLTKFGLRPAGGCRLAPGLRRPLLSCALARLAA